MRHQQSITTLPMSPEEERRSRMIKYSVAMGIRLVCIVLCFFAQGWWLLFAAIGAIVLPYVAVVLANARVANATKVLRPGSLVPIRRRPTVEDE